VIRALAFALALAAVPAAVAGSVRTVTTPGPVTAVALDARRVAYAEGRSAKDCDRVRIWNLQTRRVTKLGRTTPCVQTSTGSGIASLATAGGRALWLHYAGGNIREWQLFTATAGAPKPRRLRFVARDVDAPAPIVVGNGDSSRFGDLLPYSLDSTVVVLRANGSRRFAWTAPARVTALSALFGRVAVASEGGLVTVLDAAGRPVANETFAREVGAVRIVADGVLAQTGARLELRENGTARIFTLPGGARLVDAVGRRALYVASGRVWQLALDSGARRSLAAGVDADAQLSTVAIASGRTATARLLP
jgi:hypothetical protein